MKHAAFACFTIHRHAAIVQHDNMLDDCQSQAGTAQVAAASFVNPVESLEQSRKVFCRNSRALVNNVDTYMVALINSVQCYLRVRGAVLNCVVHEVDDRLCKQ